MRPRLLTPVLLTLALAGCGGATGDDQPLQKRGSYDPRDKVITCLKDKKIIARKMGDNLVKIGIGALGPQIFFADNGADADARQLAGRDGGAAVIGRALLFPKGGNDKQLTKIENCLAKQLYESST